MHLQAYTDCIAHMTTRFLTKPGAAAKAEDGRACGRKSGMALPSFERAHQRSWGGSAVLLIGINSPEALLIRRSHASHSPMVHCSFRQSNSQSATSSGTDSTICDRSHCQSLPNGWLFFSWPDAILPPSSRDLSQSWTNRSRFMLQDSYSTTKGACSRNLPAAYLRMQFILQHK